MSEGTFSEVAPQLYQTTGGNGKIVGFFVFLFCFLFIYFSMKRYGYSFQALHRGAFNEYHI